MMTNKEFFKDGLIKPECILFWFDNSVDPDQLASQKPADHDPHCFPLCLLMHPNNLNALC